MGEGMYTLFFNPRKIAISKKLLTYLDYDLEEIGV